MKVSEIMKTKFLWFDSEDSVYYAMRRLDAENRIEAPVVLQVTCMGIITISRLAFAMKARKLMDNIGMISAMKMRSERIRPYVIPLPFFTKTYLEPEMELAEAVSILGNRMNAESLPVLDGKKRLIGLVYAADLRKAMLEALSFGMRSHDKKAQEKANAPGKAALNTTIDRVLSFVKRRGMASPEEVSKQFKIPVQTVEKYAQSLEKHGLLKIEYNLLGKMTMKRAE